MRRTFDPFRLLLISIARWLGQPQRDASDYLRGQNRVLREHLGGKRLRRDDGQRRGLAAKGRTLGRRLLREVATIVTPETLQSEFPERSGGGSGWAGCCTTIIGRLPEGKQSGADRMVTSSRTAMVVMPGQPYWIREERLDGWHCIPASWLSRIHAVVVDFCDAPPLQEKI